MKSCPICKTKTFEDAAVCHGCLHRFGGASARRAGRAAENRGGVADKPLGRQADATGPAKIGGR